MNRRTAAWVAGCLGIVFMLAACSAPAVKSGGSSSVHTNPAARQAAEPAPAPVTPFRTFAVYTDKEPRRTHYVPSGYMGDSDVTMSGAYVPTPHGSGACLRVNYKATGAKGWSGVYWQDPANNWGTVAGHAGYDLRGATKLTFWARGDNGGEKIQKFTMGGITGAYPDSDAAVLSNVKLGKEWKQYTIDVSKKDLRHVISGFGFFVNKAENPGGITFYLDDIFYEGAQSSGTVIPSTITISSVSAPSPVPPAVQQMTTPPLPPPSKDLTVKEVDEGLRVSFSSQLHFEPGRAVLDEGSDKVLNQLVALLNAYPANSMLIEGHTDKTGDARFNLELSRLRATAVRDYLIKRGGYDTSRFRVVGYGDTRPIGDNNTKAGRSVNRRVVVTILKSANPS